MLYKLTELLFAIGLFINAALFIPQFTLLLKKKHAEDVSVITFLGFCLIQFFTVIHGIYAKDWILVIGYILSLLTCGSVTALIIIYRLKNKNKGNTGCTT